MHRNWLWVLLLCVVALVSLAYVVSASVKIYQYARLRDRAPIVSAKWSEQKVGSDQYTLRLEYVFYVKGERYEGEELLTRRPYKNQKAAVAARLRAQGLEWEVWYDPSDPNRSAVEKFFPYKACVYALVLIFLTIYLIFLGSYAGRKGA